MQTPILITVLLILTLAGYYLGRSRAVQVSSGAPVHLHSLPSYHGLYVALWCGLPALLVVALWMLAEPRIAEWMLHANLPPETATLSADKLKLLVTDIKNLASGDIVSREIDPALVSAAEGYASVRRIGGASLFVVALAVAIGGLGFGRRFIRVELRARNQVERVASAVMILASLIAILTTVGIVLSLLFESLRFFGKVPLTEFLFGLHWSPQTALRADQVGASGA